MKTRLLSAALGAALAAPAWACSTCQCGDYTVTLMGAEKAYAGRMRLSYEAQTREETQGAPGQQRVTEELRQVFGASYSFNPDLTVALRLPYVRKEFNDSSGAGQQAAGLGDLDVLVQSVVGRDAASHTRHLWGLQAGLRLPTAPEQKAQGRVVDIDAQPGTGAYVPSLGGFYRYFRFPWFTAASLVWSDPQDGDQGFDGGRAWVATLTQQYALGQDWSVQLGLEARHSAQHRYDGVADPNSGGVVSYLTPGLGWRLGGEWLLYAQAQLALKDSLKGQQEEEGEIRAGLVFDLSP